MAARDALSYLMSALTTCTPLERDQIAAGASPDRVRSMLEHHVAADPDMSDKDLSAALTEWPLVEAGMISSPPAMLLAAYTEYPVSLVVAVRSNEGIPGARVVVAQCPYAGLHRDRYKGHALHTYGWPRGLELDDEGSLGTRVPHCDGATVGSDRLSVVDLVIPAHLLRGGVQ
ncbi:hypothetical protein [uncultured Microbacterium sp.]|uniref:Uncharacterized protein n=1 Tax=uncultured Microbacterium sp. TaxID=191216 RepID=A0A1Y5NWP5_9MICO|nr:hypothetical protein [uncultured Microbacterium sp.]SBS70793.1 hypothetical protein MIPYR_10654 [uncultured Microbacterium sp.]